MERSNIYRLRRGRGSGALLLSMTVVFAIVPTCLLEGACPCDADIVLNGSDYSDISGIRNSEPGGWVIDADVIYTFWEDEWVEYTAYLTEGAWRIGVCAVNYSHPGHDGLGSDPTWYPQFELLNSLTGDIVVVPASDTIVHSGFFYFDVPSDGFYTVRFTWLNDQTWGTRPDGLPVLDANIQIERVFFKEIVAVLVDIDIKPGSYPNSINLGSRGVVPVAVLSSGDFDATDVEAESVVFAGASPVRWTVEDVDGDGDDDLLLKFGTQDLDLDEDSTEATLTGETADGVPIEGTDTVNIVPKGGK